jgi:hypothetical protein
VLNYVRSSGNVEVQDSEQTWVRTHQPRRQSDEGGLTRTIGAHECGQRAAPNLGGDSIERADTSPCSPGKGLVSSSLFSASPVYNTTFIVGSPQWMLTLMRRLDRQCHWRLHRQLPESQDEADPSILYETLTSYTRLARNSAVSTVFGGEFGDRRYKAHPSRESLVCEAIDGD